MIALFTALFLKIFPLYLNILVGYLAGRVIKTPLDAIANLLFFFITPLIIFNGVWNTRIDNTILSLPLIVFVQSCFLCLLFYFLSKRIWTDSTTNLVAFSAGSGNAGYFGLPLALLLFDSQGEGVYMMGMLGIILYENSLGFYVLAKGTHSFKECIEKLVKLPALYAFLAGMWMNYFNIPIPGLFSDFLCHIKGTYTVLGMMIIGLGLSILQKFKVDFAYIGMTFLAKFVVWPILTLLFISLDLFWFGHFSPHVHEALMLLSVVPLAVNTVILASVLNTQPEKAATAVLLGILFALIYVPLMVMCFIDLQSFPC